MGNFFRSITGFFDKYLTIGLVIVIVTLASAFAISQWRLSNTKDALSNARSEIASLEDEVLSKQTTIALLEGVQIALEERQKAWRQEQEIYTNQLQEVLNAPESENQIPVDDVLCRAISGTVCLRNN
ncbi:MAG: hypothetical protein RIA09_15650 [Hoeflea sp.]|jgi:hypothetical protein|uniref:hypothetical protein n=1 Tax=Hoeflea sp. TaxID=1940281 RepID=UPI0032EE31CF